MEIDDVETAILIGKEKERDKWEDGLLVLLFYEEEWLEGFI